MDGKWIHDEITWINNARYFIHTRKMTRKIVDVEPPQPPFSNHSSPYLATLRIYENSISPREIRRFWRFSRRKGGHDKVNGKPRSRRSRNTRPGIFASRERAARFCFSRGPRKSRDRRPGFVVVRRSIFQGGGEEDGARLRRNNETADSPLLVIRVRGISLWRRWLNSFRSLINGCGWKVFLGFISSLVATLEFEKNLKKIGKWRNDEYCGIFDADKDDGNILWKHV